jgi:cellulose synthase/poly-beta-1,6-N-acetylglucosamine synthase-like glycosyltransferase
MVQTPPFASLAPFIGPLLVVFYFPLLALLLAYGCNLYFMILVRLWGGLRRKLWPTPAPAAITDADLPLVTVQLPLYNEQYVSQRVIDAVAAFNYPANKLEIQVLDDSTDETRDLVAARVAYWQSQGLNITHIHRTDRRGFKAGALAAGLHSARGQYIAIFDADFVPPANFLRQALPDLLRNSKAAFVQARWEHLNLDASLLTRLESVTIDGHFVIEQAARAQGGFAFNFNGTAGIWRPR